MRVIGTTGGLMAVPDMTEVRAAPRGINIIGRREVSTVPQPKNPIGSVKIGSYKFRSKKR